MQKNIKLILPIVLASLLVGIGIGEWINPGESEDFDTYELTSSVDIKPKVYVSGAVENPGVYELEVNSVVIDLVDQAGGLSTDADLSFVNKSINLALKVNNSDHIYIPFESEIDKLVVNKSIVENTNGLLDINTATSADLESLPGIGPKTAAKIIMGRPYSSLEELKEIEGIGEGTYGELSGLLSI